MAKPPPAVSDEMREYMRELRQDAICCQPNLSIERHDSKVKTILFFKANNAVTAKYLLIYLDADGLVVDVDLVED